jgi:UDP-N-acetylmuramoyl-tripeptide--D-alanyl-D-alanine ligase
MSTLAWIGFGTCAMASVLSAPRWLRVAQREHYLAGSSFRFAWRWWRLTPANPVLLILGFSAAVLSFSRPLVAVTAAGVGLLGPRGLSLKGRTSKLAWTRRLKTLAALALCFEAVVLLLGLLVGAGVGIAALCVLGLPVIIDLSAFVLGPFEDRAAGRFVVQAAARLKSVAPTVVAITGSYGKTSTKNHLAALIGTDRSVVPSPRSFNNRAGLARAVNEHLAPGTDVFIAEMGTYGPGEIAEMTSWCPPKIAVLTAIGPVHLERFGSLEATTKAKAEIAVHAEMVVLNVDDVRLAALANELSGIRVLRASSIDSNATVCVRAEGADWQVLVDGAEVARFGAPSGIQATNAACALAAAIGLGIDPAAAAQRMAGLRPAENRLEVVTAPSGVQIVDDTFNSNPAGARAALRLLGSLEVEGQRVLVTPGMIELGNTQAAENEAFAEAAADVADTMVIVGRTNERALRAGASKVGLNVRYAADRPTAVAWIREALGARDAVLYENDLPDHYP